jgi:Pyoverdine/dityrosine biosynthesis protein
MKADEEPAVRDFYQAGLSHVREAVISEHFMHKVNQIEGLERLSAADFSRKAITLSSAGLRENLLPLLIAASNELAVQRAAAARSRACMNFRQYHVSSEKDLTTAHVIAEVMYDRQFSRSASESISRAALSRQIGELVERAEPIHMVIPALPFKCATPLKCRGRNPDLAEVGFLLALFEVSKTIDLIYSDALGGSRKRMAFFTVISDGRRFNEFVLEPEEHISRYQEGLRQWISDLSITDYVGVEDYDEILAAKLPAGLRTRKAGIRKDVYHRYVERMNPLLETKDMDSSLSMAIKHEPDPETFYAEGRFVPLFKSLIYTINFKTLTDFVRRHGENFEHVYSTLTKHIFSPFARLAAGDIPRLEAYISDPEGRLGVSQAQLYEYLRRSMLRQAWDATMQYLAEIRSDRDMELDPISTCFPQAIRWTIHAKPGQLALQSNPACGLQVQPWHGAGVFKGAGSGRIKLCALPFVLAEHMGAVPVVFRNDDGADPSEEQPLFYVHPELEFSTLADFFSLLAAKFTRKRK